MEYLVLLEVQEVGGSNQLHRGSAALGPAFPGSALSGSAFLGSAFPGSTLRARTSILVGRSVAGRLRPGFLHHDLRSWRRRREKQTDRKTEREGEGDRERQGNRRRERQLLKHTLRSRFNSNHKHLSHPARMVLCSSQVQPHTTAAQRRRRHCASTAIAQPCLFVCRKCNETNTLARTGVFPQEKVPLPLSFLRGIFPPQIP